MRATAEPIEGNKVKLSVTLDDEDMARALDAALSKMAKEARIPGFRPGKVPRQILQARVGVAAIRQAAINDAVPDYYAQALAETDVDPIAQPQIDVTEGEESGPVTFDATVEVRPRVAIIGYEGLAVTVPNLEVEQADVDSQVDAMRSQSAELAVVERAAADGDHVTIDVTTTRAGEAVEGFSFEDLSYEVGSASIVAELDAQLRGLAAGGVATFEADVAGSAATVEVVVKDVREKVLPEANDAWAAQASEFETLDELRAHLRRRLGEIRRERARLSVRDLALEALVQLVTEEPPEALFKGELERRIQDFGQHLDSLKMDLPTYLSRAGLTQDELVEGLRQRAHLAVKADLALRALIDAESIQIAEEDVEAELAALATHLKQDPEHLRQTLEQSNQLGAVRADLRKAKALDWLAERVELRDEQGRPVDRADLLPPPTAAEPESAAAEPEPAAAEPESAAAEPEPAAAEPEPAAAEPEPAAAEPEPAAAEPEPAAEPASEEEPA
jgi:trigger factor